MDSIEYCSVLIVGEMLSVCALSANVSSCVKQDDLILQNIVHKLCTWKVLLQYAYDNDELARQILQTSIDNLDSDKCTVSRL